MRHLSIVLSFLLLVLLALPVAAQGDSAAALDWLQAQLRPDGGYSDGFSEESGLGPTVEVVLAAAAAGEDVSTWGDASPLDFLIAQAQRSTTTGNLAKLILAAVASGLDPTDFGGSDLVERLQAEYEEESGLWEGIVTEQAYAILALHAAGEAVPDEAREALIGLQGGDGGWSFDGTSQADTNTTALAIQALIAAGEPVDSTPVVTALAFLKGQQNRDGGFPYQIPSDFGTESDANSTAWAIQALLAAEQPLADWNNPHEFLASLQSDDGSFQWKETVEGPNFLATAQAVPALEGATLIELPTVEASQEPEVEATTAPRSTPTTTPEGTAPTALPATGGRFPWEGLVAGGTLLAVAGLAARRAVARR